jgi:hypothetical protein
MRSPTTVEIRACGVSEVDREADRRSLGGFAYAGGDAADYTILRDVENDTTKPEQEGVSVACEYGRHHRWLAPDQQREDRAVAARDPETDEGVLNVPGMIMDDRVDSQRI